MAKWWVAFTFLSLSVRVSAQDSLFIPCGTSPTMDGVARPTEWVDADTVYISILNGQDSVAILYMHDGENLNFAFLGNLQSTNARFPEVLLDIGNDKTSTWQSEDWWFHVSATDCEYKGEHGNYDSCKTERPNWIGIPNMNSGPPQPPYVDTIEIQIPLNTIGVSTDDKLGLAFNVTNTFNSWEYWPTSADINKPSTWATATLESPCGPGNVSKDIREVPIEIYPNPTNSTFTLTVTNGGVQRVQVSISDVHGKTCFRRTYMVDSSKTELGIEPHLSPGVYLIRTQGGSVLGTQRLLVE